MKTNKEIKDYSMWVQIICLPITWGFMVLKVVVTIPLLVIATCNDLLDKIE